MITCMRLYAYVYTCIRLYVCMCVCVYVPFIGLTIQTAAAGLSASHQKACVYVCMCVCVCICVYACIRSFSKLPAPARVRPLVRVLARVRLPFAPYIHTLCII